MFKGRCIFPATGYLELVWVTLATMKGPIHHFIDVEFEDIRFQRATAVTLDQDIDLTIMVHYGSGKFEVSEGSTSIVTGVIREVENAPPLTELEPLCNTDYPMMAQDDFYKELSLRGYNYTDAFRSVIEARSDGLYGRIKWDLNWVSFMDCILQIGILSKDTRSLMLPTRIEKLRINSKQHMAISASLDPLNASFEVYRNEELGIIQAGGVEIIGMVTNPVSRRKPAGDVILESYQFVPHHPAPYMSLTNALRTCVQIVIENNPNIAQVKAVEFDNYRRIKTITILDEIFTEIPLIHSILTFVTSDVSIEEIPNVTIAQNHQNQLNSLIVLASDCLSGTTLEFEAIHKAVAVGGYLVSREVLGRQLSLPFGFKHVATIPTENDETLLFLQKVKRIIPGIPVIIEVSNKDTSYQWLNNVRKVVQSEIVVLFAQNEPCSGIIGLVNCLRKEPDTKSISCFFIDDSSAPLFSYDDPFYSKQIKLGLAVNVLRNVRLIVDIFCNLKN